jgi:hypothetical protein
MHLGAVAVLAARRHRDRVAGVDDPATEHSDPVSDQNRVRLVEGFQRTRHVGAVDLDGQQSAVGHRDAKFRRLGHRFFASKAVWDGVAGGEQAAVPLIQGHHALPVQSEGVGEGDVALGEFGLEQPPGEPHRVEVVFLGRIDDLDPLAGADREGVFPLRPHG